MEFFFIAILVLCIAVLVLWAKVNRLQRELEDLMDIVIYGGNL